MKFNVENYTFSFILDNEKYMLTVDDESCDYGCTFSIILRDSVNLEDMAARLAERNLKYHLYKITPIAKDTNNELNQNNI